MDDKNKLPDVPKITESDIKLVKDGFLNVEQMKTVIKPTPDKYKRTRKGPGGKMLTYVSGAYMEKLLNMVFGWDWDFNILDQAVVIEHKQVWVKGRLSVRCNGREVVKEQFGRATIKFHKQTEENVRQGVDKKAVDIGNDMKAAATDALKKCASKLGFASDVYAPEEYREVNLIPNEAGTMQYIAIEQLLARSGVENRIKEAINEMLEQGISRDKAVELINALNETELEPIDAGNNYTQKDILKKLTDIIDG